jgi:hypothetical protein
VDLKVVRVASLGLARICSVLLHCDDVFFVCSTQPQLSVGCIVLQKDSESGVASGYESGVARGYEQNSIMI